MNKHTKPDRSLKSQIDHERILIRGLDKNPDSKNAVWTNRILIGTPCTGMVRMEWVLAKNGQIIPTNWSQVDLIEWVSMFAPMEYVLPDAENLMAKVVVEGNYEWFLQIEQDNVLPPDAFVRINEYMIENKIPIISGLYFTKSQPPEPILYRGRGNGSFRDFKLGDKVWVDGIPFGFTLTHGSIIKALWDESEEYMVGGQKTRRVFATPNVNVGNFSEGRFAYTRGTTDLAFCKRIMDNDIFTKAGWPEYQKMKYPFLVDTNIFLQHIDDRGRMYPLGGVPKQYKLGKNEKPKEIK